MSRDITTFTPYPPAAYVVVGLTPRRGPHQLEGRSRPIFYGLTADGLLAPHFRSPSKRVSDL